MLDGLKRRNRVVGIKETRKAAEENRLECLIVASDADLRVVGQLKQYCEEKGIPIHMADSMKQLGKAAGIDVGASVVGVLAEQKGN
ncbi:MAG TPA: ribosomal L7Ae/L30e/S12e/Gadd45 family protein [Thermoclostridium caenicola]|uniref:LSU ribosomal protein L7AE n=1 Tax=Thermoclostridium caenicola TaxID=659425 RepID=A0A1M6I6Z5_9FIRM|nr:ribosomal L7Ae/L30e/S12e/Gadd45 family protein [Thermoclostridium caenicola]SHJ30237.1 LSU ribosomal protein L7AE [Thermoclostridium caenicola]HOK42965.1 ribosomal L7Ae/L30e/S12e/Gadd45 family protein [Thermoclostridium caenicola]HOL83972.1 ribosomal L7Ae/L30e/S12e/Gadd45 family protein [Thermoclostridium caenicola]HOP72062.1 ribosomal L7Ae/L30e/S12e/Gadd45 family protein [Thermoclostridium caenicola]HPO75540.1 ribosomal L7Ae/L30e/S12e/Gadd45 family protein [Thermoclostridium caenicola]